MANVTYTISLRDRVTRVANRMQSSFQRLENQVNRVDTALSGLAVIAGGAALTGVFRLGAELQKTELFFNTLTGSVEKGTKLFNELKEFANATPFSNQALNRNAQVLLAFGQESDTVTNTLRTLGDVAAGDQEKLRLITLAFSQIQAAGRLMGQDLLQLINAGFNPLQEISDATGLSMLELKKRMSQGQISANLVTKAFQRATGPGGRFHNLTLQMADTLSGRWSTAIGKAETQVGEFGKSMEGIFAPFLEAIIQAIDLIEKYRKFIFPVAAALGAMLTVIVGIVGAVKAWIAVQAILNAVMAANPLLFIVAVIAGLITAIIVAYRESETFRKILTGVWFAIKEVAQIIQEFHSNVGGLLAPVIDEATEAFQKFGQELKTEVIKQLRRFVAWVIEVNKKIAELGTTIFNFFGVDQEEFTKPFVESAVAVIKEVEKFAQRVGDAYNKGLNQAISSTLDTAAAMPTTQLDFGINSELKKLQAEGIVSGGGIKTFNININSLTGVNTLSTTNLDSGASDVGNAIQEALLKALADIKNIG